MGKPANRPLAHKLRSVLAFRVVLSLLVALNFSGSASAAESKVSLYEFLAQADKTPLVATNVLLDPQWVGTVKRAFLKGGKDAYPEDRPSNIRLTHLLVREQSGREPRFFVASARRGKDGGLRFVGFEAPAYMSKLPSVKTVSEAKNLDDLLKMFGPQHGGSDGWGSDDRMHWTEGWTWFTVESKEKLRYLNVFAHVSAKKGQTPADIDILRISEGFLRPADPNSAAERDQFKTPDELFAVEQRDQKKAREIYPLLLRELLEARHAPDDSDLLAYKRALNQIRSNPPPELFGQFAEWFDAEWVDQGSEASRDAAAIVEIKMMLEILLFDNLRLGLNQWEEQKRKLAFRSLNNALPRVKTSLALCELIVFILRSQGGGELKMAVPGTNERIDLQAPTEGGAVYRSMGSGATKENLRKAAEACRDALKERYADLR